MKTLKGKTAKTLLWCLGLALCAVGIGVPSGPAEALVCVAGASCDDHLTITNSIGVTADILVNVNNTGADSIITVTYLSSSLVNTPLGIDQFGYASDILPLTLAAGWSTDPCATTAAPCTMDGFGDLVTSISSPGGTDLTFSLTLNGLETAFGPNDHDAEFAVHVRFAGIPPGTSCSFFASDGTTTPTTPSDGCVNSELPRVPEPGTLLLLGSGLGLLGFTGWRRWIR